MMAGFGIPEPDEAAPKPVVPKTRRRRGGAEATKSRHPRQPVTRVRAR